MRQLTLASLLLKGSALLIAAASVFHFLAAPHLSLVLERLVDVRAYAFLEPIVRFTFLLNGVLLAPLAFSTFYSARGVGLGERWAWRIATANALTVVALPCTLVATLGLRYFAGAPLFVAGAASALAAGLMMLLALAWGWSALHRLEAK